MSRRSDRFINSPMLHGINQKSYASMHRDLVIFPFLHHKRKNNEHGFFLTLDVNYSDTSKSVYSLTHWQVLLATPHGHLFPNPVGWVWSKAPWHLGWSIPLRVGWSRGEVGKALSRGGGPEALEVGGWCFWWNSNRFLLDKNSAPEIFMVCPFLDVFFFWGGRGGCIFWKIGRGLFLVT